MKKKGFIILAALLLSAVTFAQDARTVDEGVIINGVKWATRNVDKPGTFAAKPEDTGMFYQWNHKIGWSVTEPMINSNGGVNWEATIPEGYRWVKANDPSPKGWYVPTGEDFRTLLDDDYVSIEWTTENGVNGRRFTDKTTGNSIFLPAAGYRGDGGTLYHVGSYGGYWSGTQLNASDACSLYFYNSLYFYFVISRSFGFSVRPVAE